MWEEQQLHLLEGVHILLCKRPLVARDSVRMSICRVSGGSDGRRNTGRKDGGDYKEEQRIAMKKARRGGLLAGSSMVMACCTTGGMGVVGPRVAGRPR